PRNYDKVGEGVHNNRKYLKSNKGVSFPFYGGSIDSIVVIDGDGKAGGGEDIHSLDDPRAEAMLAFWYSRNLGVVAIGFPQSGNSGDVYFCVSSRCLFAK